MVCSERFLAKIADGEKMGWSSASRSSSVNLRETRNHKKNLRTTSTAEHAGDRAWAVPVSVCLFDGTMADGLLCGVPTSMCEWMMRHEQKRK